MVPHASLKTRKQLSQEEGVVQCKPVRHIRICFSPRVDSVGVGSVHLAIKVRSGVVQAAAGDGLGVRSGVFAMLFVGGTV